MDNLKNKTILITGGTGSFGHELLKTITGRDFKEVRIFSRDELKQEMMRLQLNNPRVKFYIGDIRDRAGVDKAMEGVNLVFHAAALKQVPSCEFFPMQAVMTNILGSSNVVESAIRHKVESVVCLGTDKAVYPVNAMGMTKALMEKISQAACRGLTEKGTRISCVRYGNVMCSRGSVIPLFIKQIKEKKPITVTEAGMTRFLLPLNEAIKLVLFAFSHAKQGNIFIKKSPACTVGDLARALKELFKSDVPVKSIGIRHGEKIYETLASTEELRRAQDMGDYFRVSMDGRDLNYNKYFTEGDKKEVQFSDYTSHNTERLNVKEVKKMLLKLPEVVSELK
ncbi:MAG: polysaccharide biosynthesis protein [Elusimicrobiota bacterium]